MGGDNTDSHTPSPFEFDSTDMKVVPVENTDISKMLQEARMVPETAVDLICSKAGQFAYCAPDSEYGCSHAVPHEKQLVKEPVKEHLKSDCDKFCGCRDNWGECVPVAVKG